MAAGTQPSHSTVNFDTPISENLAYNIDILLQEIQYNIRLKNKSSLMTNWFNFPWDVIPECNNLINVNGCALKISLLLADI